MTLAHPALRTSAVASSGEGGTSPDLLLVSQSIATAVRAIRLTPRRRTCLPSGSDLNRAGMKPGPSFSPSRRQRDNTSATFLQVMRSESPIAGPSGLPVGNQEITSDGSRIIEAP